MRTIQASAAALLLCAAAAGAGVKWESDYEAARQRALDEDKLLLIVFSADW